MTLKDNRRFPMNRCLLPLTARRKSAAVKTALWALSLCVLLIACDLLVNVFDQTTGGVQRPGSDTPAGTPVPVPVGAVTITMDDKVLYAPQGGGQAGTPKRLVVTVDPPETAGDITVTEEPNNILDSQVVGADTATGEVQVNVWVTKEGVGSALLGKIVAADPNGITAECEVEIVGLFGPEEPGE
jgi:hypothetical protein